MNNYYFGGGIRRSFMTFGGVVPEIKKLDYEVPYVDPERIYGFGSSGKNYQKNTSVEIKKPNKTHALGSGDCENNSIKENIKGIETKITKNNLVSTISQKSLDLNISNITNNQNKFEVLPQINSHVSIKSIKDKRLSLPSTQLNIPSITESLEPLKIEELKQLSTPIKLSEKQVDECPKKTAKNTPKLMKTWKSYKTNIQKQIKRPQLPRNLTMSNIFKNQIKLKSNKAITNNQDKEELIPLKMTTSLVSLPVDEVPTIGVINSLKEEFEMYRKCFKIQKENPIIEEESKNDIVHYFENKKEKKIVGFVKKIYLYVTNCLYFQKT